MFTSPSKRERCRNSDTVKRVAIIFCDFDSIFEMATKIFTMCPLWPLHIILLYILCLGPLLLVAQKIPTTAAQNGKLKSLNVTFSSEVDEKIVEGETKMVNFLVTNLQDFKGMSQLEIGLSNSNPEIATVDQTKSYYINHSDFVPNTNWTGSFNLTARFLGYTKVVVQLWGQYANQTEKVQLVAESEAKRVAVIRPNRAVDKAFIYTVAILVSVAFVNMGCTLDLDVVKATLKRPIGPAIGFFCQYIFMPVCAFGLAKLLLAHNPALQLGLFVAGCSPGGGASNMWTFVLGGNLHLSMTMTFISTIAAFAMMPFWTMTLGRMVFTDRFIVVPYRNIATLAAGLVIPTLIGLLIRRYLPKLASILARTLKPVAGIFLLVIIGFGIYANLYMIQLMDWRVILSAMALSWLGYTFGGVSSFVFRRPWQDSLAIAVETGVQNTGIAIFILRVTLEQPDADINTVIPVAVAIMTPIPLLVLWALQKIFLQRMGYCLPTESDEKCQSHVDPELTANSSVEKLLPNNNSEIPVIVKVLDDD